MVEKIRSTQDIDFGKNTPKEQYHTKKKEEYSPEQIREMFLAELRKVNEERKNIPGK